MRCLQARRTLFIGIGSPHGDDRIGWRMADALTEAAIPDVEIRKAAIPCDLLDWLEDVDRLFVCDACYSTRSATAAVALHQRQWPTSEVSAMRSAASHALGLPQVLRLAERLGTLPSSVTLFGIEGRSFDAFAELSPEIAAALGTITHTIAAACAGSGRTEAADA